MNAVWLFLYLGCLVQMLTLYRLDLHRPATLVMVLPILALPLLDRLAGRLPWLTRRVVVRGAGLVSLVSAIALARSLNLGFWETWHLGLAVLCALVGGGLLVVLRSLPREGAGVGLWIWIAAWQYAAGWHPVLPFVGAGVSACLGAFGRWPQGAEVVPSIRRVAPFWSMTLLGLVLSKPWYDFNLEGDWARALALCFLVVGVAGLSQVRAWLSRLPAAVPVVLLALAFGGYHPAWLLAWAAVVGLCLGALWKRLPRPLPMARLSLGFLLGTLVSYGLHSNLAIPFLGRLLWWGS